MAHPSTQSLTTPGFLVLPPDFDFAAYMEAESEAKAQRRFDALMVQQQREADRAKRRSSSELAERYGISKARVQEFTRQGILPGIRAKGGFGHWSYPTGQCDDAIEKLKRADGTIKGSWRPKSCRNRKAA
jgi:hypothetical protein